MPNTPASTDSPEVPTVAQGEELETATPIEVGQTATPVDPRIAQDLATPEPTMVNGVYVGPPLEEKPALSLPEKINLAFNNQAQIDVLLEVVGARPVAEVPVDQAPVPGLDQIAAGVNNLLEELEVLAETVNDLSAQNSALRDRLAQIEDSLTKPVGAAPVPPLLGVLTDTPAVAGLRDES